jgi:hypothetical protein
MFDKLRKFLSGKESKRQKLAALMMLVGSGLGLLASFVLSIESLTLAKNSHAVLNCDLITMLCNSLKIGNCLFVKYARELPCFSLLRKPTFFQSLELAPQIFPHTSRRQFHQSRSVQTSMFFSRT